MFSRLKDELSKILPVSAEIHHIGSTAVLGLSGKGIIDIMVTLPNWKKEEEIISSLRKNGYLHIHPKKKGRISASLNADTDLGDHHLHIVLKNSAEARNLLFFRDQLCNNPKLAQEYQKIKEELSKDKNQTRATYSQGKNYFIKSVIKKHN
jgi:GrpB-like predicted nucleotidyltransferase (UPF0157 family)